MKTIGKKCHGWVYINKSKRDKRRFLLEDFSKSMLNVIKSGLFGLYNVKVE